MRQHLRYPVLLRGRTQHVSLSNAAVLLELWYRQQWQLSEDEFEELFDALVELMGEVRNERWRLRAPEGGAAAAPDDEEE